jgi:PAS domain S-box-containing protein
LGRCGAADGEQLASISAMASSNRAARSEMLQQLEHQRDVILNSAGEGIYHLDLNGNFVFVNPKGAELVGCRAEELIGKPAHDTIHYKHTDGRDYPVNDCPILASIRDGAQRRISNDVFWRKDGSSLHVDYIVAPIKGPNGKVRGTIVTFRDATSERLPDLRIKLQAEQYRLLFETNPSPMWVFDVKTLQIVAVNQVAITHYGYSRDEFLKLTVADLRAAEDVNALITALSGDKAPAHYSGEFRHRRKDGSFILTQIYSGPIVWEGTAARIVTAIDITERKRVEEELRNNQAQLRTVFENLGEGIVVSDLKGNLLQWNRAALELHGYNDEDRRHLTELVDTFALAELDGTPLSVDAWPLARILRGETLHDLELRVKNLKAGWQRIFGYGGTLVRDDNDQPLMAIVTIRDITRRKEAEVQVREQAEMLDHAHDAIIVRSFSDRQIVFWNAGAERLYGWGAEEAIGQHVGIILADPNEMDSISDILLKNGEFRGVLKEVAKDGRELFVEVWSTLIRNSDGTPRSVLSINNDITEQKKLEVQLLRAQRLDSIGTLASGVAHDLNNILTPILMAVDIARTADSKETRHGALSLIEESAKRGAGIVKQVLTFARGVEGERVLIKPSHLIEEMIDIAKKTFPKNIHISSRYPEDIWTVNGDPTQLHQVLMNLCVNARDAMANGGSLVIWAENMNVDEHYAAMAPDAKPGPYIALRVSDTGAGMPPGIVEKIFDPFFTTKELGKGTGLGLSTVSGIIKSHGGFINVYSEIGRGTTFKIFLPAQTSDRASASSETSLEQLKGNGELILVVDDEESILRVTKMILESKGYKIITAHDGPEAVAIFAREMNSISLVLTDMSLPLMDGVSLIRSLQKLKPSMPFIASTGQSEHAHADSLAKLGVTNLLTKPYDTQKLLEALHSALSSRAPAA